MTIPPVGGRCSKTGNVATRILGIPVHRTSYEHAAGLVLDAVKKNMRGFICHANVHMVMEAHDSPGFAQLLERALLVTPDGMPLVWVMRLLGQGDQRRVYGPQMMLEICQAAQKSGTPIGLIGSTESVLDRLGLNLKDRFPGLEIAYNYAPPFGTITKEQNLTIVREVEQSGAKILFVAMGCPKQERWMAEVAPQIPAVLLGVGAAFDFISGNQKQAPTWLQQMGLEWLFRLYVEPKRLLPRYLKHNPRFVLYAARDVLMRRVISRRP